METAEKLATIDPVWLQIRDEAMQMAEKEPAMSGFLHATILNFDRLELAIASHLSEKLANSEMGARSLCEVFEEAFADNKAISEMIRADIVAHFDRDPACRLYLDPVLYFKGDRKSVV